MSVDGIHIPSSVVDRIINNTHIVSPLIKNVSHKMFLQLVKSAVNYSIDPLFVIATWQLETGHGKSLAWNIQNNPAGIKGEDGNYRTYASQEEGIEAMCKHIRKYIDEYDRKTVDEIRSLWSESEDSEKIVKLMKRAAEELMHE